MTLLLFEEFLTLLRIVNLVSWTVRIGGFVGLSHLVPAGIAVESTPSFLIISLLPTVFTWDSVDSHPTFFTTFNGFPVDIIALLNPWMRAMKGLESIVVEGPFVYSSSPTSMNFLSLGRPD